MYALGLYISAGVRGNSRTTMSLFKTPSHHPFWWPEEGEELLKADTVGGMAMIVSPLEYARCTLRVPNLPLARGTQPHIAALGKSVKFWSKGCGYN
jgi:hypothetical protein